MFKPGWPLRLLLVLLVLVAWIALMVQAVEHVSQAFYGVDFVGSLLIGFFGALYTMTGNPLSAFRD